MSVQESAAVQNWKAFWNFHLGNWDGRWTRYQPSGAISETFLSRRSFQSDPDKKIINQLNQYFYTNGKHDEKRWSYTLEDHCKDNGFMHPASDYMRGLAFQDGSAAWLVPQAMPEQYFPMELFLANNDIRFSVGLLYGLNGELQRTACIREKRLGLNHSTWSNAVELIPAWNIGNQWRGNTQIIAADLARSTIQDTLNIETQSNHQEYFFPDNIILRCPAKLTLNRQFTIDAIWLETRNQLKIIRASYGVDSKLIDVQLQHLSRQIQS